MARMRTRTVLAACSAALVLTALVAAGCGSEERAQTVRISPDPGGSTSVSVGIGDTVVVSLAANATTGYAWQFTAGDTFTIEKSEYVPDPNPEGLAGAGGTQVVTLKVTSVGTSDLSGLYVRAWETPSPSPAARVTVTIDSD